MTSKIAGMALALALGSLAGAGQAEAPAHHAHAPASFVPADFAVPTQAAGKDFRLVPLGPQLARIDYEAYMSSVEHLQKTFTRSTAWPHAGITDAEAMQDMETEQARFRRRASFAYSVLTPDGTRERGCVYVRPSKVAGYDAEVRLWVTKDEYEAGFEDELYAFVQAWMAKEWPFGKVAYPGRSIDWATWDALQEAK